MNRSRRVERRAGRAVASPPAITSTQNRIAASAKRADSSVPTVVPSS